MAHYFAQGKLVEGIIIGIENFGEELKKHCPSLT
jgi:hypothetical protein